jgi:hypothetical protein
VKSKESCEMNTALTEYLPGEGIAEWKASIATVVLPYRRLARRRIPSGRVECSVQGSDHNGCSASMVVPAGIVSFVSHSSALPRTLLTFIYLPLSLGCSCTRSVGPICEFEDKERRIPCSNNGICRKGARISNFAAV